MQHMLCKCRRSEACNENKMEIAIQGVNRLKQCGFLSRGSHVISIYEQFVVQDYGRANMRGIVYHVQ